MTRPMEPRTEAGEVCLARVEARVAARKAAKEIIELLSWPDGYGADYADAFVETIRELLPKRRCPICGGTEHVDPLPGTVGRRCIKCCDVGNSRPVPIARLGATRIEYGEFIGQCYDDIPLERLDWYCRKAEENAKSLRAYLKHPDLESRRRGMESG